MAIFSKKSGTYADDIVNKVARGSWQVAIQLKKIF